MGQQNENYGQDQFIINDAGTINIRTPAPISRSRNEQVLLQAVKDEVTARLKQSLHREVLLNLGKESQPSQVKRLWDREIKIGLKPATLLPNDTTILEVFDDPAIVGKLLILGQPGAGKTTTLLDLASALIERASEQTSYPIPVLFNLSTWKDDRQPVKNWLIAELKSKYGVREPLGKKWIETYTLLPMLDGLDELESDRQELCVLQLNHFLQGTSRPLHLIVCSRNEEYAGYETQLKLNGAIFLTPLTDSQIQHYLDDIHQLNLWHAITKNSALIELVRQPLLLSVTILAYAEMSLEQWQEKANREEQLEYLLDAYIRRMLSRPTEDDISQFKPPSLRQTHHWLVWLASALQQESRTEFLIEDLQPQHLLVEQQGQYKWQNKLRVGVMGGLLGASLICLPILFIGCWQNGLGFLLAGSSDAPLFGLGVGLLLGLGGYSISSKEQTIRATEALQWSWLQAKNGLLHGLSIGTIVGLLALLFHDNIALGSIYTAVLLLAYFYIRQKINFKSNFGAVIYLTWIYGIITGLLDELVLKLPLHIRIETRYIIWSVGLSEGLKYGLISSITGLLVYCWNIQASANSPISNQRKAQTLILIPTIYGLTFGILESLSEGLGERLGEGLKYGLISSITGLLVYCWNIQASANSPISNQRKAQTLILIPTIYGLTFGILESLSEVLKHESIYGLHEELREGLGYIIFEVPNRGLKYSLISSITGLLVYYWSPQVSTNSSITNQRKAQTLILIPIVYGLTFGMLEGLKYGLIYRLSERLREQLIFGLLAGLGEGLKYSLISSITGLLVYYWSPQVSTNSSITNQRKAQTLVLIPIVYGLTFGLNAGLTHAALQGELLNFKLSYGLIVGSIVTLMIGSLINLPFALYGKEDLNSDVESSGFWNSWLNIIGYAAIGGASINFIHKQIYQALELRTYHLEYFIPAFLITVPIFSLFIALLFALFSGTTGRSLEAKVVPNQGIWRSLSNAKIYGLAGSLSGALLGVGLGWLINDLTGALLGGAIGGTTGLITLALTYGGTACIQHFTLRHILYKSGNIPWNYSQFLDYCTERLLLQRVGGRYRFIHKLLQDHFSKKIM